MPNIAQISLGSNLGDRQATIQSALQKLVASDPIRIRALSSLREYPPVGGPSGQSAFLNAAATLETTLDPEGLLAKLLEVEIAFGRSREVHWQARTLDLDLILFDDQVLKVADLEVPHPRFALRRFVLEPLNEIARCAVDPVTGRSVRALLRNLERRPGRIALPGDTESASSLRARLEAQLCPSGWQITQSLTPRPTLIVLEAGACDSADKKSRGATVLDRWNTWLRAQPDVSSPTRPPCPVYLIPEANRERSVDDLVAICLGITGDSPAL